ncbi:ATP-dependent RNA helicase DDX11 [Spatholobus suberectus]|nr:ATP-dependent RNA helicase DDX11 [Spatholobus suberectus]
MLLRETIRKTKLLFHKTLRSFKSVIFGGYQKLPRSLSFNPFLGRSGNARTYTSDQFYNEFYDMLQSDLNRIKRSDANSVSRSREQAMGDAAAHTEILTKQSPQKSIPEDGVVEEKKSKGNCQSGKKECLNSKGMNEGVHDLAQKMKELEMMDSGDVEHVLDIEEALHYYSRLKSPVYLDIVDKFFTDMHSEISVPQSSISIKRSKSKGRLGSSRL